MKKYRGPLLLLLAALVWGLAFVAQTSAAGSIGAFTFNAVRSLLAALFLLAVIGVRGRLRPAAPAGAGEKKETLRGGVLCGLALFVAVNLQQFGIGTYPAEAAASGRSGFLTATYVVMVALSAPLFGKKLRGPVLLAAAGCLGGMYLLCLGDGFSGVYLGDALELGCAAAFAGYILIVDRYARLDSIKVSCLQFLVCGVLSLAGAVLFETVSAAALLAAWLPICYVGIFSGGVGYTLQMVGQKDTEPAVASIVMSLESVVAALAGWAILGERLSGVELLGCALVFGAVVLAQIPGFVKPKEKTGG